MRDEITHLIAQADAEGTLTEWLERMPREGLSVAYANRTQGKRSRQPFYPVNKQDELDDILMRDGYTAFLDKVEADGTLADFIAATGSNAMLAAFSQEMRKRRQEGDEEDAAIGQLLRQAGTL